MKKKNINRRARRGFSSKRLKGEIMVCIFHPPCVLPDLCGLWSFSPLGNQNLSFSGSPAGEDKKKNEEKAESAEILF
jgi:hypothetical protein